jgi:hypothetical protein
VTVIGVSRVERRTPTEIQAAAMLGELDDDEPEDEG